MVPNSFIPRASDSQVGLKTSTNCKKQNKTKQPNPQDSHQTKQKKNKHPQSIF